MNFAAALRAVRETAPLVHLITNFVTVNDCANMVLAAGGSPTMARDPLEVAEVTSAAEALVLNLGAIGERESMLLAGKRANELRRPIIFDPVAVGVSTLRRETAGWLLEALQFAVIRGNASEIRALALGVPAGSGVDAAAVDAVTPETLPQVVALAQSLARRTGAVTALSGAIDVVTDGAQTIVLSNGCPTMGRVTGSGCMLSALTGTFCAALPQDILLAAAGAMAALGVSGDRAEVRRLQNGTGTATFRTDLIDGVSLLTPDTLQGGVHYALY